MCRLKLRDVGTRGVVQLYLCTCFRGCELLHGMVLLVLLESNANVCTGIRV